MRDLITPLILTYNEEDNIERIVSKLWWANRILVIDSGSSDQTCELLARNPRVDVIERAFDTHATQWNSVSSKSRRLGCSHSTRTTS